MLSIFQEPVPRFFQDRFGPPDHRIRKRFLINSPLWLITILSVYATLLIAGTKFMRNRKAFKLKSAMIVYNSFQVIYSSYVFKEVLISAYLSGYNLHCAVLDKSESETALRMVNVIWLYYISKIIDLTDSVFFVLRKKRSQLTFLHCYHHSTMTCNWYIGALYSPGGQAYVCVVLNSFVHIIMYTYYLLSAMGPEVQKYLWWKKYLTQIQLVQFFMAILHIIRGINNNCDAPNWLAYFTIVYLLTLVVLFLNFYIRAYISKQNTKTKGHTVGKCDLKAGGDWKYK